MSKRRLLLGLGTLLGVRLVLFAFELRQGLRRQATRPESLDPYAS
jgi:hypothetical protein